MSLLETAGLIVRFSGGFTLGPVDLSLGAGVHHLAGPNGAGKTTLLRCLCGVLPPTAGAAKIAGRDPFRQHAARRDVAWLPAASDIPEFLTVEESWRAAAALRGDPRWDGGELQAALGLPSRLRLDRASAGQQRKAALLAAFAADPPVLLLDEPFANLDAPAAALLAHLLEGWRRTRVILITTHEPLPLAPDSAAALRPGEPLEWRA